MSSSHVLTTLKSLNCTCKDAACLISQQAERKLSTVDRIGLRLHLVLCRGCRRYSRSVKFLKQIMRHAGQSAVLSDGLSAEARDRIRQRLKTTDP